MKHLVVMVCGFLLGGWAVPLGFVLGLGPAATFLSAAGGGLLGCWGFLLAGDRLAARVRPRRRADASASIAVDDCEGATTAGEPSDVTGDVTSGDDVGRVGRFVDRYGVRGLGLVGPIFPGVTASVVGGLALSLDRRELGRWLTIGIIVMYGLYALGLSFLLRLF